MSLAQDLREKAGKIASRIDHVASVAPCWAAVILANQTLMMIALAELLDPSDDKPPQPETQEETPP